MGNLITGKEICAEISRMKSGVEEVRDAIRMVDDTMGKNTLPYTLLKEELDKKSKELEEALGKKYTVTNGVFTR